jgi:hypothetical protein
MHPKPSPVTPLGTDLWHVESTVKLGPAVVFPCRMTIARLPSGGLWLHSPVALDDEVAAQLLALGPVEHLVAPNLFHHMFMGAAQERFPDATTWCAPGLEAKRKDLSFDHVLTDDAPAAWAQAIDQRVLHGSDFNEVVFFARPSAALIMTDLIFNMSGELPTWGTKWITRMAGAYGRPAQSRFARFMIKDRARAGAIFQAALDDWPFELAVMAHGDPITQGARAAVESATTWMRGA